MEIKGEIGFENWMKLVDVCMEKVFGLSSMDMPDWNWRDAFDDGLTPEEAVGSYGEEMNLY